MIFNKQKRGSFAALSLPRQFRRGLLRGNRSKVSNGYAELFHEIRKLLAGAVRTICRGVAIADLADVAIAALININGFLSCIQAKQLV